MGNQWIDLSQDYYENMPPAKVRPDMAYKIMTLSHSDENQRAQVNLQQFTISSHQGTHVDAFKHLFRGGKTIDQIPLNCFAGSGVVLDISNKKGGQAIIAEDLKKAKPEVQSGDVVLIYTGWEGKWHSDDYFDHPYFSVDAAQWLVDKKVKMFGMDTLTPDIPHYLRTETFDFPVHRLIIGNEIIIIENLGNLAAVVGKRVTIVAFPLKILGADGAPARVAAMVE